MENIVVKASATPTTDRGEFTAIAAAYSVDRVKDRIVPGAFKATIERWRSSGKLIPLHWNHEGDPKSIIGSINPQTMSEIPDQGLYVEGRLDLDSSDMAREAWRSMKANRMGLSFGYLVDDSRKAGDGVTDLKAIDLFEVSIVPAPANADTRILSVKGAPEEDDLKQRAEEIEREDRERTMVEGEPKPPEPEEKAKPGERAEELEREVAEPEKVDDLTRRVEAIERKDTERTLLEGEPKPPESKAEVSLEERISKLEEKAAAPEPVDELAQRRAEVERTDAERTMLEGEPKASGMASLMSRMRELMNQEAAPTAEEMLAFARRIMSTLGDSPAKSLEELHKATERAIAEHMRRPTPTVDRIEGEREAAVNIKAEIEQAQEALVALELFEPHEVEGAKSGALKAVWTTAYINDLPDSSFLYVESGGTKDSEGKTTPRSLRHFPYKDASGAVDLPHLRNALSRIPQSGLPQDVKDRLTARAQRILDNSKTADGIVKEPRDGAHAVDPLRRQADAVALEFATRGLSLEPTAVDEQPKPKPKLDDLADLKRRMHDDMLAHIQGEIG